jgi:ADP-ribose pyrophosphatase YjhB (NUDIX family)
MTADGTRVRPARPVLGIGAVVIDGNQLVLVKRAHAPLKGEWSLPGGAVELGESLAEAVRREVLEETGLIVDVGPVVEVVERVQRDRTGGVEYHFVIVDYKCRRVGGTLTAGSDAADARWADLADLRGLGVTDTAVTVVHKAFALSWPAAGSELPTRQDAHHEDQ